MTLEALLSRFVSCNCSLDGAPGNPRANTTNAGQSLGLRALRIGRETPPCFDSSKHTTSPSSCTGSGASKPATGFLGVRSQQDASRGSDTSCAGWPWVVTHPGLPQIRTCAINASGSSRYGFATRGSPPGAVLVAGAGTASRVRESGPNAWRLCESRYVSTSLRQWPATFTESPGRTRTESPGRTRAA